MKTKWFIASSALAFCLMFALLWLTCLSTRLPLAAAAPVDQVTRFDVSPERSPGKTLGPAAQINACGTITSTTTWGAGNTYVANGCDVIVSAGYTLTIEPGATAKFSGTSSALIVFGALLAESNDTQQPINFTSFTDDAHGMDVDGSPGSVGSAGQWYGLHFLAGSYGRLRNAFVGYAGSGDFNYHGAGWNVAQVRLTGADVQIRNTLVSAGLKIGIFLDGAGMSPLLDTVQVRNNVNGNVANPGYAIFQDTINMTPTLRNLALSGNDVNAVTVYWGNEAIQQNVTIGGSGVPYRFDCHYTGCQQIIPAGKTLTITPGTEFQYDYSGFRIVVQSGGSLVAEGTATQRITFTSAMTTPQAGNWEGIQVDANGSARLAYCDVGYGGGSYKTIPALNTYASNVQVRHTRFHDNGSDGIQIHGTNVAPVFEDVDVLGSGGYGLLMGSDSGASLVKPTWDGGIISGSGKTGILISRYASAPQPTFRNMTIANNHGDGIVIEWNGAVPTFENLAITGNTGAAVNQSPDTSPVYRNLTLSGNGTNAVVIPGGTLNGGRYWGSGQPELPYQVQGNIAIPAGAFLSLEPGMTLRFITNTYMNTYGGGSLYALGTPERPIAFTGLVETPGFWAGIKIDGSGQAILQNCEIGYAGANYNGQNLYLWSTGFIVVQNCSIHHSLHRGIFAAVNSPILANNSIYSNTDFGVIKDWGGSLDARNNWWGDPSGPYHATLNSSGKGDKINDERVIFTPWLTAPPTQTLALDQVIVKTGGPRIASPGQTTDYAIQYTSLMTRAVQNAVLMLQLPNNSAYLESTDGGIYWPLRNQVFWRLGDLPAGANGIVSARIRFNWGVTWGTRDGTVAILAGTNYGQADMDVTPYLSYQSVSATGETPLSDAQVTAELAAYPNLRILFTRAISAGFAYRGWGGTRYTLDSGQPVTQVLLLSADRSATVFLRRRGAEIQATTMARTYYAVADTTGGMTISQQTRASEYWGAWAPVSVARNTAQGAAPASGCSCLANCAVESAAGCIAGFTGLSQAAAAWQCLTDPLSAGCASAVADSVPIVGCIASGADCARDCALDASSHCCSEDQVGPPQGGWGAITDFFGVSACQRKGCNTSTGNWEGVSRFTYCPTGQKCVSGKGCGCGAEGTLAAPQTSSVCAAGGPGNTDCGDSDFAWARDPNALYGPAGDLVPGQRVTYTITYENVGQGDAFGVFVTDQLNDYFDMSTLTAYPTTTSTYVPSNRTLVWPIGQLGPKGTPTSTGAVSFTVRLKSNLPGGTLIVNQATVYFPSVPEETPTNPVVNAIQPVVAVPQMLQTNYGRPVTITLQGVEVSGRPLSFTVTQPPLNGLLSGNASRLVYTPAANFSGLDRFNFKASNGITESRSAEILIQVNPTGDTLPPRVEWTMPVSGTPDVPVQATPAYTDSLGPVYPPFIMAGFSEAISSTSVTTQTVQWRDGAGRIVPGSVTYDGTLRQMVVAARQPLRVGTLYTVTLTRGVLDLAGNPLAASYSWSFRTGPPRRVYLPLVRRR
jgi:hypothetical protein